MPRYVTLQDAATTTGDGSSLDFGISRGPANTVLQISNTFVATITFEATLDRSNWIGVALANLNSTTRARTLTATTTGLFLFEDAGAIRALRARISTYTSGTVDVVGAVVG